MNWECLSKTINRINILEALLLSSFACKNTPLDAAQLLLCVKLAHSFNQVHDIEAIEKKNENDFSTSLFHEYTHCSSASCLFEKASENMSGDWWSVKIVKYRLKLNRMFVDTVIWLLLFLYISSGQYPFDTWCLAQHVNFEIDLSASLSTLNKERKKQLSFFIPMTLYSHRPCIELQVYLLLLRIRWIITIITGCERKYLYSFFFSCVSYSFK